MHQHLTLQMIVDTKMQNLIKRMRMKWYSLEMDFL